jgi:hypothetical protein
MKMMMIEDDDDLMKMAPTGASNDYVEDITGDRGERRPRRRGLRLGRDNRHLCPTVEGIEEAIKVCDFPYHK